MGYQVLHDRLDLVEEVHADFLMAGAQVITLSSYSATPTRLRRLGCEELFEALQQDAITAAHRAREHCGSDARIAGCLPPLPGSYRPDDRFDESASLHEYRTIVERQARHVDLFICETLPSIAEGIWATRAAKETGLPVWTAFTVAEKEGRILRSGESLTEAADAAAAEGADAILVNCSPPEATSQAVMELAGQFEAIGAYANGFKTVAPLRNAETVDCLEQREDLDPDRYAEFALEWVRSGATLVGGCCEVGPSHIERIGQRLNGNS